MLILILKVICNESIDAFADVGEPYRRGLKLMQMTMQYILKTIKQLQIHIQKLQSSAELEKASHEKIKAFIHKQVSEVIKIRKKN